MDTWKEFYRGKTVLLTGHTGFKGAWLAEWLLEMGARVVGVSRDIPTKPSLFEVIGLGKRMEDHREDITDYPVLEKRVGRVQPDIVFHLAAQSLVRYSYEHPLETCSTNIMGTANLLQALRCLDKPCGAVMVTSDKCYENRETGYAHEEMDTLGGHDPYSSSKGAAELVIQGFRRSFFPGETGPIRLASARAGNVIGGGDFSRDRIFPDCVEALSRNEPILVRNPGATRPWQHVLEPLSGYLLLACKLYHAAENGFRISPAYNFGPGPDSNRSVRELVEEILKHWEGGWKDKSDPEAPHEASLLMLSSALAHRELGWSPRWGFSPAVEKSVVWYRQYKEGNFGDLTDLMREQIREYASANNP